MRTRSDYRVAGFSLVELLVVIAILAVLIGLILPATQAAREWSNLAACQNNLRQIGVALVLHHDSHRVLPHNGGWDGKQEINATDGSLFTPSTLDKSINTTFRWGVGQPGLSPTAQTGPWCFSILPFLDQQEIHQKMDWTKPVASYICLSRRTVQAYEVIEDDKWGSYQAGGWKWGKTDYGANEYLIGPRPKCLRFLQITDGVSNTLMVGEKAFDPSVQMPSSWYYDEGFFIGGSAGTARHGLEILRDGNRIRHEQNWGAAHKHGANFLFADGSVRVFAFDTPWSVMAPQLVPNDGDVLPHVGN